jgi:hypothetical protein
LLRSIIDEKLVLVTPVSHPLVNSIHGVQLRTLLVFHSGCSYRAKMMNKAEADLKEITAAQHIPLVDQAHMALASKESMMIGINDVFYMATDHYHFFPRH